jgi:hypothetical protein
MKRVLLLILIFLAGALATVYADSDTTDRHGRSVEEVLRKIRESQDLGPRDRIDPDRVDNELLEELGEALMSLMVPDPREHAWMDDMMGGEGSDSLASMHRVMGYRYLSGEGSFHGSMGMMGPMGGGMMMGPGMMGGAGMMGSYYRDDGWLQQERSRRFWSTTLPWTLTGILSVAVTALSVVVATR